ncbi:hypothetical protein U251_01173 [Staphylococcus aureus F62010]|nr:hypothetical protein U183_00981 [Staphylococcus aureus F16077]EVW98976.1 hypothetical protein U251_01173 [Staphylococcus aureus F62010]
MYIKITPQFNCEKYHKYIITLNFPKFKSVFYCRKLIKGFSLDTVTDILANKGILDTEQFGLSVMVAFGYRQQDPPKNKTRQAYEDVIEWVGPKE